MLITPVSVSATPAMSCFVARRPSGDGCGRPVIETPGLPSPEESLQPAEDAGVLLGRWGLRLGLGWGPQRRRALGLRRRGRRLELEGMTLSAGIRGGGPQHTIGVEREVQRPVPGAIR